MRAKMLLFTLTALAGFGQNANLVGLPEYSVTLGGTIDVPTIVNNSGKALLGYVVHSEDANGNGPLRPTLTTREIRPIRAGEPRPSPPQVRFAGQGPIVKVVLDAVIFADGHFVGPDKGHSFDTMSLRIDTEPALARRVSRHEPDIWAELENLAKVFPPQLKPQQKLGQDIVPCRYSPQAIIIVAARVYFKAFL